MSQSRARLAAREAPAGSRLPYAAHVADHIVALRDGSLMTTLKLAGFPFETADDAELDYRAQVRASLLKSLGTSRFALYSHVIRRRVAPYPDGEFADPFAHALDAAWRRRMTGARLFVNDLYLSIIRRPLRGRIGIADSLRRAVSASADREAAAREFERDRRALDAPVEACMSVLEPYGPTCLGLYEGPDGLCSEPAEFLGQLYNGELRAITLPRADLGHHLTAKRVTFGDEAFERRGATAGDVRVGAILSIKDYPTETQTGMLDALLRLPHELTVAQGFGFVDGAVAIERMKRALRRLQSAGDAETRSLRTDMEAALDEVSAGRAAYGEHHLTIELTADDPATLDDAVGDTVAALTDLGAVAVREDVALEPAFWAQFPGNFRDVARGALISTGNFGAFASLHNLPLGRPRGNHWGAAVTMFETTAGTPYFFSFHKGDVGNFTLIGATGAGKTVLATFLVAQAQKFDPRTVYFDKDRGAEIFIRAMSGCYSVVRAGVPSGWNPFALPDTPSNRAFLRELLGALATPAGAALTPEDETLIAEAVDAAYEQPPALRRLGIVAALFAGRARAEAGDLSARLARWHGEGSHAWLFDNAEDELELDARTIGIDMSELLDDPAARGPALLYLFHRVAERLDGSPAIIIVDEGWKALDDPAFAYKLKDLEKTIRKKNGLVGFITQSAHDLVASSVGAAIIEQSPTQLFLPNPHAGEADYCAGFGLSARELEIVRTMPDTARFVLVRQGREGVVVRLDLSGADAILSVLSGRETTVRLADSLRGRLGDRPADWLPAFIDELHPQEMVS